MTNRRITVTNPRLTLRRRACRFIAGPSMTESDHYNRKIERQLNSQKRREREAMKTVPPGGGTNSSGSCAVNAAGLDQRVFANALENAQGESK